LKVTFLPHKPMKTRHFALIAVLASFSFVTPLRAENPEHLQKLLATGQCVACDLSEAGLTFAKLNRANLSQANLAGANLSRANLQGADLRGANLTGTSLHGANLVGARLDGAQLVYTDLRGANLSGASLEGVALEGTFLQQAIGLPNNVGKAEDFYRWAIAEAERKNHPLAVENFTQTLSRRPNFAPAYLGRSISRLQSGDREGAMEDAEKAEVLFKAAGDTKSVEYAQNFIKAMKVEPPKPQSAGNGLGISLLGAIGGILQFLPIFLF
jgi:tetratricopeptide (TPR) repeat protein